MVEIKLAETAGFCWGVKRAIDISLETARGKNEPTYTLGPLIHNPQLIDLLKSKNIHTVSDISEVKEGEVIIRTHGITPKKRDEMKSSPGLKVKDATCPLVARVQAKIRKYSRKGYTVIIVGDDGHAEVIGLKGYAETPVHVVAAPGEVAALPAYDRVFVAAQTTCDRELYESVVAALEDKYGDVEVGETICDATSQRQEEVIRLASEVEAMVIVGGRNSANTTRLAKIAGKGGIKTFHVETDEELKLEELKGFQKIGVTAGASTPKWLIDRVLAKLGTLNEKRSISTSFLAEALRFTVKSNLYIAFGAAMLSAANMAVMGIAPDIRAMAVSFFAILATYLLNQLVNADSERQSNPLRYHYHNRFRGLFWGVGLCSLLMGLALSWDLGKAPFGIYLAIVVFGSSYGMKISPWKPLFHVSTLKDIPASRATFTALAWGLVTVCIPYLASERSFGVMLAPFVFTFGISYIRRVLFDFRDMQGDQIVGKEALPILMGKRKAANLLYGIITVLAVVLLAGYASGFASTATLGMFAGLGYILGFMASDAKTAWGRSTKFELFLDAQFYLIGALVLLIQVFS